MSVRSARASKSPWYVDGLCFSCTGCGHCCRIEGYVWVRRAEAREIAALLGMEEERFARKYLRRVGRRYSLIEKPGSHDCIFWEDGCTIYPARPNQCRTFPFWSENLRTAKDWEAVDRECPGVGEGRLYEAAQIDALRKGSGETAAGEK